MALASQESDPTAADAGPRIYGVVDAIRPGRVAGWAIDRADSAAAVEIDVRREGRLVATVRADRPRRDLERGGVGTGRYGFACDLDPPLQPGFEFTLTATARTADGATCELKRAGAREVEASTDRRLVERIFEIVSQPPPPPNSREIEAAIARLEIVQARIEAALSAIEAPQAPPLTGLRAIAGLALAAALASLVIGVTSLWLW